MPNTEMHRRSFIKTSAGLAAASLIPGISRAASDTRPNILYIMSDDHTTNAISCYGSRLANVAPTPNIDRIAGEGMRLTRCFCTNSICTPSRATIMTGQYSHVNGVYTLNDALDPDRDNVAKELSSAGYNTAIIGKWHLHTEPSGFDYWNVLPGQGRYHDPIMHEKGKGEKIHSGYSTDVVTDLSIDWMKKHDGDSPFFLMCHFKAPHEPWEFPERLKDYLADTHIPEPESLWEDKSHRSDGSREYGFTIDTMAERQTNPGYHTEGPVDTSGMNEKEKRKNAYQVFLKRYLRTITAVDENVGRLLDFLDENGLAENTVVIYTSDQGYFLGEHNYIDKRWIYGESLQMPFLVRYPKGIDAGTAGGDIVLNVDFAPTFLDYAGLSTPDWMQGRSARPIFEGTTPPDWRESAYYRYWMHTNRPAHFGVTTKRHKLAFFYGRPLGMTGAAEERTKPGWELYDLEKDPHELNNVYDNPAYADVAASLKKELARLKREVGDEDNAYPVVKRMFEEK